MPADHMYQRLPPPGVNEVAQMLTTLLSASEHLALLPEVIRKLDDLRASQTATSLRLSPIKSLEPDYVYSLDEAAKFVGKKKASLHKEPESVLPRVKSRGKTVGIRGVDLLAYRGDISYQEAVDYKEAKKAVVTEPCHSCA